MKKYWAASIVSDALLLKLFQIKNSEFYKL